MNNHQRVDRAPALLAGRVVLPIVRTLAPVVAVVAASIGVNGTAAGAVDEVSVIHASDAAAIDRFGTSIDSNDNLIIVGATHDDNSAGIDAGGAYIYEAIDGAWVFQQKIVPGGGIDQFAHAGSDVAISATHAFLSVADADLGNGLDDAGAVDIYQRVGSSWEFQQRLIHPMPEAGAHFGWTVAANENIVAIGTGREGVPLGVVIFSHKAGEWKFTQHLQPAGGAINELGASIDIGDDRIIAGAPWDLLDEIRPTAAYIFHYKDGAWVEQACLAPIDGLTDTKFGRAVSIRQGTALVGAPDHSGAGHEAGAVYVYAETGLNDWITDALILPWNHTSNGRFGMSVDGNDQFIVIGAAGDGEAGTGAGASYLLRHNSLSWSPAAKLIASDAAVQDGLGSGVCLTPLGALSGVPLDDTFGSQSGSVYQFDALSLEEDCNGNGMSDSAEISWNWAIDKDNSGTPDECDGGGGLSPGMAFLDATRTVSVGAWNSDEKEVVCFNPDAPLIVETVDGFGPWLGGVDRLCTGPVEASAVQQSLLGSVLISMTCDAAATGLGATDGAGIAEASNGLNAYFEMPVSRWANVQIVALNEGFLWHGEQLFSASIQSSLIDLTAGAATISLNADREGTFEVGGPIPLRRGHQYQISIDVDSVVENATGTVHGACELLIELQPTGDINGDGAVDVVDFLILLNDWGPCIDDADCFSDINGDGAVDVPDMLLLLSVWP